MKSSVIVRRRFSSQRGALVLIFCAVFLMCAGLRCGSAEEEAYPAIVDYTVRLDTVRTGFDGKMCWVHARAGIIPSGTVPVVLLTMHRLLLSGSDVFSGMSMMRTADFGASWTAPELCQNLTRRKEPDGTDIVMCDVTPKWHEATGTLLATGHTVRYRDDSGPSRGVRWPAYSVYDSRAMTWSSWEILEMPDKEKFRNAGAGSTQRVDLGDGTILLPVYFETGERDGKPLYGTTIVRCDFDGRRLRYKEHGDELTFDTPRGIYEPSLAEFKGAYYLTMRNDDRGYVTRGYDGMHFEPVRPWKFDDGEELGNYNTQQHWASSEDGLFLIYTRRGADNDHVFRHRAPLFIAQIDPVRLCVLRSTERILVPERGARLGNFGVTKISGSETWVTVTEWMQPEGCEKYGSDNAVFVAKISFGD